MIVGEYRIERRIGSGGFGTVWQCQHTRTGRFFALKIDAEAIAAEDAAGDSEQLIGEEWKVYRALDYGRGEAARAGITAVYETGGPTCLLPSALPLRSAVLSALPAGLMRSMDDSHCFQQYLVRRLVMRPHHHH